MDSIRPFDYGYSFETANGFVTPQSCVSARITQLKDKVEFVIMKDCPPISSLGKLVREQRYEFHWLPSESPYLYHPGTKQKILLEVEYDTPMLPRGFDLSSMSRAPLFKNPKKT